MIIANNTVSYKGRDVIVETAKDIWFGFYNTVVLDAETGVELDSCSAPDEEFARQIHEGFVKDFSKEAK